MFKFLKKKLGDVLGKFSKKVEEEAEEVKPKTEKKPVSFWMEKDSDR